MPKRLTAPPWPTAESLRAAALAYVARYATNSASLHRVLNRRLQRALSFHPQQAADHSAVTALRQHIDQLVAEIVRQGFIHDADFAAMTLRNMRRSGRSARAITAKLTAKGIAQEIIHTSLAHSDPAEELAAARRLAQRRHLGPWGNGANDPAQRRRDWAALARAGFNADIARQVLGEMDEDG